jgi:CheY-like chemotaxis protein
LLAFSRKQVLQPQRLDVNHLLADVERMLRRLIGEDVRIETRFARDLGTVLADPGQLSQVLLNLAVNARDAMPQGGTLTLATSNITVRDWRPAHDRPVPPGDYVTISVEDTGVGMSDEVRKHIFEPFFTTKEKGRGTGLGLSTAYGIISQSGGHIAVDTRPLRGTRFDLYLPRVDGVHDAAAAGPAGDALVMGGHETVLVTEDQTEVRRLACSVLRSYGYRVIESANADEALEWCGRDEVAIDLLVTDVVMPGLSGRELADRVQRVRPALKVLFMSGYTEEAIVHHGVLDGSVAYLAKPFTPQALALKVRQVLGAQRRIPA